MPIAANWIEVIKQGEWSENSWTHLQTYLPLGQNLLGTTTVGM